MAWHSSGSSCPCMWVTGSLTVLRLWGPGPSLGSRWQSTAPGGQPNRTGNWGRLWLEGLTAKHWAGAAGGPLRWVPKDCVTFSQSPSDVAQKGGNGPTRGRQRDHELSHHVPQAGLGSWRTLHQQCPLPTSVSQSMPLRLRLQSILLASLSEPLQGSGQEGASSEPKSRALPEAASSW